MTYCFNESTKEVLSIKTIEIESKLEQEKYQPVERSRFTTGFKELDRIGNADYKYANRIGSPTKLMTLFDEMMKETNDLPTQAAFVERAKPILHEEMKKGGYNPEKLSHDAEVELLRRSTRIYMGALYELHFTSMLYENVPNIRIFKGPNLDFVFGVDLIVEHGGRRYYLHLTTSKNGMTFLEQKKKRGKFDRLNTWKEEHHIAVTYNPYNNNEDKRTKHINQFPLVTKDAITELFNEWKEAGKGETGKLSESEFATFYNWTEANQIKNTIFIIENKQEKREIAS